MQAPRAAAGNGGVPILGPFDDARPTRREGRAQETHALLTADDDEVGR